MRLLHVERLEFQDFSNQTPPPYIIASHRWLEDETTYQDVRDGTRYESKGYTKVARFAKYVKDNISRVQWLWIDTCCIDKTSSTELDKAINSMFTWYKEAALCLAHLHDVASPYDEALFRKSDWFTRGWTLQELLAPTTVVFLSKDWQILGHKEGHNTAAATLLELHNPLNEILSAQTGVPEPVLRDFARSSDCSYDEKWAWVEDRRTTVPEDMAYCMLGIFDVELTIRYRTGADGGKVARDRVKSKIVKRAQQHAHQTLAFDTSDERLLNRLQQLGLNALQYQYLHVSGRGSVGPPADLRELSNDTLLSLATWSRHTQPQHSPPKPLLDQTLGEFGEVCVSAAGTTPSLDEVLPNGRLVHTAKRIATSSDTISPPPSTLKRKQCKRVARFTIGWRLLSRWASEIIILRTLSGWNMVLHSYATVPNNAPIFQRCLFGDMRGMQELVSAGQASWFDRNEDDDTLLDVAFRSYHLNICQHLLANVDWPEPELVVHQALSKQGLMATSVLSDSLSVFFGQYRLEFDLDWLVLAKLRIMLGLLMTSTWWSTVARNMSNPWYELSLTQRFALIFFNGVRHLVGRRTPSSVFQLLGIEANAEEWLSLESEDGESALHLVAQELSYCLIQRDQSSHAMSIRRAWADWGSELLRRGLNPFGGPDWYSPCFLFLDYILKHEPYNWDILLDGLHTWLNMIQNGNIDLWLYRKRENKLWKQSGVKFRPNHFHLLKLVEGESLSAWSLKLVHCPTLEVYTRSTCPGEYPDSDSVISKTICWLLSKHEEEEGVWVRKSKHTLFSQPFDIREQDERGSMMLQLIDSAQDDAGIVVVLASAFDRRSAPRARSKSTPPPIHRRHREYCRRLLSHAHPWMPHMHLCPSDQGFRMCKHILEPTLLPWLMELGSCVRESTSGGWSICQTVRWSERSFLAEIDACQELTYRQHGEFSDGKRCPQGCDDVVMDFDLAGACLVHRTFRHTLVPFTRRTTEFTAHRHQDPHAYSSILLDC